MSIRLPLLVFSDLDGTLLDHQDYGWDQARPGLGRLREMGAGLVLASSKTAAEIEGFVQDMGFSHMPAIVENGAGILWPNQPTASGNADYLRIRKILTQVSPGFLGFADMGAREVSERTGLDPDDAERARKRCFSEPGLWMGSPEDLLRFIDEVGRHGLHARQGGRFLTLSFGRTKADAMSEVIQKLNPAKTIALGDAPNDLEMILAADIGVIVANHHGTPIPALNSDVERRILRTKLEGPKGWTDAILSITAGQ